MRLFENYAIFEAFRSKQPGMRSLAGSRVEFSRWTYPKKFIDILYILYIYRKYILTDSHAGAPL